MTMTQKIPWSPFSQKHRDYIKNALKNRMNVAEGAIRSGKTIDHCIIAAAYLETCPDKYHLATGSTIGNAKLNIGVCNGFGLEALFRGRCRWGKYKNNEALFINTQTGEKIVIFSGGGKADSYKHILGNSYGLWIATEINEHYDSQDSRTSFLKVAMGRQLAAKKPFALWDLNPCNPTHTIYQNYIDKYKDGFAGGYQYCHFTIFDNLSISEARRAEIVSAYTQGSVWYRRDILGQRCPAEGLIYQLFADNEERYMIEQRDVPKLMYINIGVDFGGNGSNHAFTATGLTEDCDELFVLKSRSIKAKNTSVTHIREKLQEFVDEVIEQYGFVDLIYADSAEQAIINELRNHIDACFKNSIKNQIVDRIRCTDVLLSTKRLHIVRGENEALQNGLRYAVWDMKKQDDCRLDNGTSDIDVLDAFEYSWEQFIRKLLNVG